MSSNNCNQPQQPYSTNNLDEQPQQQIEKWDSPSQPQCKSSPQPSSPLTQCNYQESKICSEKTHGELEEGPDSQLPPQERSFDEEFLNEIERKSNLYEAAKEDIVVKIRRNFEEVIENIKKAEDKALEDVEIEMSENPFAIFLENIYTGNIPTDEEMKNILSEEIPQYLGPDEESLQSLYKEVETLKDWQRGKRWILENISILPECCAWEKCSGSVEERNKYSVMNNSRIASKINDWGCCTIIGNNPLPRNKIIAWSVEVLQSRNNDGDGIYIGVAPFNINQDECDNYKKFGWYLNCYDSKLNSGPPHNYKGKEYGPRKKEGEYVRTGDRVGVVMDVSNGNISFVLYGMNRGIAFEGVSLDKPLVPCVLLYCKNDSMKLDLSKLKENVDISIPVPPEIKIEKESWYSITIAWDAVEGASFYQVEVDGNSLWSTSTEKSFTKTKLHSNSRHLFRVRTVRGNKVSEWSNIIKGRTEKAPDFKACVWKGCPDCVDEVAKYSVDEKNPRIATEIYYIFNNNSTIIGNVPLPFYKVTSWNIKILKSEYNNGDGIFIGIAPFDINQDKWFNYKECGWYFHCYTSTLFSGPPHMYECKEYGPRKGDGNYFHAGDSIGVVMDTTSGEVSFVANSVNYGVAYEGIPLDRPLVPCVLLGYKDDFVELDTTEVKENVDSSIPIPSNITTISNTWNSITLTWDAVDDASFYQIEVDGNKYWSTSTTNLFTKTGFFAETEHIFRVRTVRRNSANEWSNAIKGKTTKKSFDFSAWKERPDYIDEKRKYYIDEDNPRIVTRIGCNNFMWSTIIGNTPLPLNDVFSWKIKILESRDNDGNGIYVGIAPSDIGQNVSNFSSCGWFFDCCSLSLYSGIPHNYVCKKYGPKQGWENKVQTEDSVGVAMNTTRGDLSFILNGVNYGVAYEGIPLDKPLVPCVLLKYKGDSVELII